MNLGYIATSGWVASALSAAAVLGIADLLAERAMSAQELAAATYTSKTELGHILRLLSQVGVFSENSDGRFSNTPDSELLRSNHPQSLRYFCQLAAGDYQRVFMETLYVAKVGEPAASRVFGESLYAYMDRTPDAADIYDRAMEDLARPVAAAFAASRDFASTNLIADIGGGRGTMVKALLKAHSHLRGMVVDRLAVCSRAQADLSTEDPSLASRLTFVPGDFFLEVPAGADIYLLKNVLHNFGDASALALLAKIACAMRATPGARLIAIEPHETPPLHRALDSLLRAVLCEKGSSWRSMSDLEDLLAQAGFEVVTTHQTPKGIAFLEVKCTKS